MASKAYTLLKQKIKRDKSIYSQNWGKQKRQYYIVSYPKSGNTWVRLMLANLLSDPQDEVTLKNLDDFIPPIQSPEYNSIVLDPASKFNLRKYQFIKSHDPYMPYYKKRQVIYILRDGRDAINSYLHYLEYPRDNPVTIPEIIRGEEFGGLCSAHIEGWLNGKCKRKLFIKYEDLIADAFTELNRILSFIGWDVDSKKMQSVINSSSFDNVRLLEKRYGLLEDNRIISPDPTPFIRKGIIGDWESTFSDSDIVLFWELHGKSMKKLGYSNENGIES